MDETRNQLLFEKMEKCAFGRARHGKKVDPNGEALVWCRECSGLPCCRLGPKLMNRCRPEKKDTWNSRKQSSNSKKERYQTRTLKDGTWKERRGDEMR